MDYIPMPTKEQIGFGIANDCARYADAFYHSKEMLAKAIADANSKGCLLEDHDEFRFWRSQNYGAANCLLISIKAFQEEFQCESRNEAIRRIQKAVDILAEDDMFSFFRWGSGTIDIGTAGGIAPSIIRNYLADMEQIKKRKTSTLLSSTKQ